MRWPTTHQRRERRLKYCDKYIWFTTLTSLNELLRSAIHLSMKIIKDPSNYDLFWGHSYWIHKKQMAILFICHATTFCFNRKYISWGKKNIFANIFICFWLTANWRIDCNSAPGPKKKKILNKEYYLKKIIFHYVLLITKITADKMWTKKDTTVYLNHHGCIGDICSPGEWFVPANQRICLVIVDRHRAKLWKALLDLPHSGHFLPQDG